VSDAYHIVVQRSKNPLRRKENAPRKRGSAEPCCDRTRLVAGGERKSHAVCQHGPFPAVLRGITPQYTVSGLGLTPRNPARITAVPIIRVCPVLHCENTTAWQVRADNKSPIGSKLFRLTARTGEGNELDAFNAIFADPTSSLTLRSHRQLDLKLK
jgi:hypothetical protein